jgi:hypothetical protein
MKQNKNLQQASDSKPHNGKTKFKTKFSFMFSRFESA